MCNLDCKILHPRAAIDVKVHLDNTILLLVERYLEKQGAGI